ncbi:hypothetical protein [Bartonella sp. AP33XZML]|uniref:hypothetical protein n=1 Tax=Bartonella sp. AP33XZML TaxID=3243491 RepID=UPI0035D0311C
MPWEKEDGGKKGGCGSALESVVHAWSCLGHVFGGMPVGVLVWRGSAKEFAFH